MSAVEHGKDHRCSNCGAPARSAYCPECGQRQDEVHVSVWQWLREFVAEQFLVDRRLPRTFKLLVLRPGFLTTEWLDGRRARYLGPLRLYLLVTAIFFGLILFTGGADGPDASGPEVPVALSQMAEGPSVEALAEWVHRLRTDERFAAEVGKQVARAMPQAMFVLLPLFALLLKLLYRGSGIFYTGHLTFSLHVHAFFFLVLLAVLPVSNAPGTLRWFPVIVGGIVMAVILIYLYRALAAVYEEKALKTVRNLTLLIVFDGAIRTPVVFVWAVGL